MDKETEEVGDKDEGVQDAFRENIEGLPIDTGWAYVVMIGISLWNFFVAGTFKSFGVFYVEFLDLFQERPSKTAWIGGTFGLTTTLLAPFGGYIADKYSMQTIRIVIMCCAVVTMLGFSLTSLAPNFWVALVTYGIIAGTAVGIMDSPILSMLGVYFRKKRSFASGVGFAGASVGTGVLPPLIVFCVSEFTIRGALLIFGALWLHTLLIGAVMRPISRPFELLKPKVKNVKHEKNSENIQDIFVKCQNFKGDPEKGNCSLDNSNINEHIRVNDKSHDQSRGDLEGIREVEEVTLLKIPERKYDLVIDVQKINTCIQSLKKNLQDNLDFLSTHKLLPLSLTFICMAFAYCNQFFILPPLANELGLGRLYGSLLVVLPSLLEIITRIATGVIASRYPKKKHLLILSSSLVAAITSLAVPFYMNKYTLMVHASVVGLFGGVFIPLVIPMLYDVVKPSQIGRASGMYPILTGIGISLGPPFLGAVKENSGTYVTCLQCCGLFYVMGIMFLGLAFYKPTLSSTCCHITSDKSNNITPCNYICHDLEN